MSEVKEILTEREMWKSFGEQFGWVLHGWDGELRASYFIPNNIGEPIYNLASLDPSLYRLAEVTMQMKEGIEQRINEALMDK